MSELYTKVANVVRKVEEILLSAAISVIAIMTIVNVFCRTMLGFSLAFAEEISQFSIIVVTFVGLSYAASYGRHIRMTAIYDQLNEPTRKVFMLGITGITSLLMFLLTWYACEYVMTVYELGGVYPALRVPFWVIYTIAPIGLFLAGVQYSLAFVRNLTSEGVYLSFDVKDEYEETVTQGI